MPGTTSDKPIDMTISALSTDMRDAWYPLSLACDLLPGDVVGLHLLGDPVCLYRDRTGRAACLSDRCAHRSAPLSIGRVRDAELECKYHGMSVGGVLLLLLAMKWCINGVTRFG